MRRRPSDTENKLLLLYAIDRLNAVTAQQLLLFMVENDFMDYIALQLSLAELVDARLLRKRTHAAGALYSTTREGLDTLAMFQNKLPPSLLAAIDGIAEAWRLRFRREKQMLSEFSQKDGAFEVRLRLLEWDADLLDMRLSVPMRKQAQRFCDAWIAQAPSIYAYIMHALGEGEKEAGDR